MNQLAFMEFMSMAFRMVEISYCVFLVLTGCDQDLISVLACLSLLNFRCVLEPAEKRAGNKRKK